MSVGAQSHHQSDLIVAKSNLPFLGRFPHVRCEDFRPFLKRSFVEAKVPYGILLVLKDGGTVVVQKLIQALHCREIRTLLRLAYGHMVGIQQVVGTDYHRLDGRPARVNTLKFLLFIEGTAGNHLLGSSNAWKNLLLEIGPVLEKRTS